MFAFNNISCFIHFISYHNHFWVTGATVIVIMEFLRKKKKKKKTLRFFM